MRNQAAAVKLIVGLLKKGMSKPEIKSIVYQRHPKIKNKTWDNWFRVAIERFNYKVSRRELSSIYSLHLSRYEKMYNRAKNHLDSYGDVYDEDKWKQFITYTKTSLMALRKKEEMMGLHPKDENPKQVNLVINNGVMVVASESTVSHITQKLTASLKDLSLDEMIELRVLLKTARKQEIDGVWPTRLVKRGEGEDIQDISFIEVEKEEETDIPENVIEKMKVEKEPITINLEEDVSILQDITKSMEKSSQDQLLKLLSTKKVKK
jgi:hypothetical protein